MLPSNSAITPRNPQSPPLRRSLVVIVVAILAVIGAGGAWSCYVVTAGTESTDSAYVDGHRIVVAPQAAGRIGEIMVNDNQSVVAGQILLRIDDADYVARLEQALASEAQSLGALSQARAQVPVIEAAVRQALSQVRVAEANARRAANDAHRYRKLDDTSVSQLMFDAIETQNLIGSAQVDAARQTAAGAEAQVAFAKAAIDTAEANVRSAKAQVALAKLNLSYCAVRAPVAGVITRKTVEAGNYVQVGQPLLNLVADQLFVTANFKETQLTQMRPGQKAVITVDTFPGERFVGQVDSIMSGTGSAFALLPPENATGNFVKVVQRVPVKIEFDYADAQRGTRLALGMSVIARVDVSARPAE